MEMERIEIGVFGAFRGNVERKEIRKYIINKLFYYLYSMTVKICHRFMTVKNCHKFLKSEKFRLFAPKTRILTFYDSFFFPPFNFGCNELS